MRRLLLIVCLPLVWVPTIALALTLGPHVPWWALGLGVVFWVLFFRRRRLAAIPEAAEPGAALFSPVKGGGY